MAEAQRNLSYNHFRDNTIIQQGNGNVNIHHYPRQPVLVEAIRAIPYPRNEDIVNRQDLVSSLNGLLQQPTAAGPCSAALWGLGGSGKTQIALDFAYRQCEDSNCSIFWVHADTEATFLADYKTIGKKLGVDETLDGVDLLNAVRQKIESRPPWVIILDNADDLRLFGVGHTEERTDNSLLAYIPHLSRGMILWTSRDKNIAGTLVSARRGIEVQAMTSDEATLLLQRTRNIASTAEEEGLAGLLEELQRLPLAVSQAGVFMRRTSTTIEEYLRLLKQGKSRWEVLKRSNFDRHRRPTISNSVLETYWISIERIREESELSYWILHVIAYVSSQDIPYELIEAAVRAMAKTEGKAGGQIINLEVRQAVSRLQEFSFLSMLRKENGKHSYDMHKLVQESVRFGLRERGQVRLGTAPTQEVESEQSQSEAYYTRVALHTVDMIFPEPEPSSWGQCEQYLPHALEVSDWAEVSKTEIGTATLLYRVSSFLHDRGRWGEREAVIRRALKIREQVLGAEHPATLIDMSNLALTYEYQGRWTEAETLGFQALEIGERVLGFKHPGTLCILANLALTYLSQGRWKEAETLGMQVIEIEEQVLGAEHPHTLSSMCNLALTYSKQGRWKEAETLGMQVMEIQERVLGAEHPHTLTSMGNLASTYSYQGRWKEAEMLKVQVMEIRQRVLGAEHPHTLNSMNNLASTYGYQGRWKEAETLGVQVMEICQQVLGAEHPNTLTSMSNLAMMYHSQARYDDAVTLHKATLDLQQRVLGDAHPDTAQSIVDLATAQECLRQKNASLTPT